MTLEDRIRALAHRFWQEEGCPDGRHEHHWQRACDELGAPQDLRRAGPSTTASASGSPTPSGSGALAGADDPGSGFPDRIGVDDLNVGNLSSPNDDWPTTGRSKLAGS
jgi:hypothetical protein